MISGCALYENLVTTKSLDNSEIIKAQHIQMVYFDIKNNPSYYNEEPVNWKDNYTKEEIEAGKQLYINNLK